MTDTLTAQSAAIPPRGSAALSHPLRSRQFLPFLAVLFVGSGCAALIYEIVWLQLLSLVIGISAISLGVLLGTFMGGMCLGSLLFPRMVSKSRHPLRVYAVLELMIGAIGIAELFLVPFAADMYTHLATTGAVSILLRATFAGVCLLPPTILMGATLPAIARWVETTPRGVSWLGFFYGGNIMGAVFGCLLAGYYLLRLHDMQYATLWAAAINATVATLALLISMFAEHASDRGDREETGTLALPQAPGAWTVYVAIAISGLTGLGAEVVWTRLLSLMLGATVYTFSNILAVFLLGLGIGSSVGSFIARSVRHPRIALAWCQILLAGAIAWAAYSISFSIPFWPISPSLSPDPWHTFQLNLACSLWAILPGAVLWGASFPLALAAVAARGKDAGKLVGGVYAANTVGAIVGSLAFSMFIIPSVGTQNAQRILVVLCVISGIMALAPIMMPSASADPVDEEELDPPSIGVMVMGLVLASVGALWLVVTLGPPNTVSVAWGRNSAEEMPYFYPGILNEDQIALIKEANNRGLRSLHLESGKLVYGPEISEENKNWIKAHDVSLQEILQQRENLTGKGNIFAYDDESAPGRYTALIREGMNVSVAVTYDNASVDEGRGYRYFHGAGKVQASSDPLDMRLQRTLGHISALTAHTKDGPKDVLVVACGAGVTAGSFVPYGSNITIVDIEPMVPKFVTPKFWKENHDVIPFEYSGRPSGYKNTTIHIDDGRHYIRTTREKFDVITSDPIDPWVKGCAALNTVEYYQMCRDHLKPGGVMALWIPLYESSEETSKSVICTFFKVFPQGILWSNDDNGSGYDAVLFGAVPDETAKPGEADKPLKIDIDAMQAFIDSHEKVKQSLNDVKYETNPAVPGSCEAVELLATYAGTAPRMTAWSAGTENLINHDSNLRLQYIAGLGINLKLEGQIFNGILRNYSYPDDIFSSKQPERISALKQMLESTGRLDRGH